MKNRNIIIIILLCCIIYVLFSFVRTKVAFTDLFSPGKGTIEDASEVIYEYPEDYEVKEGSKASEEILKTENEFYDYYLDGNPSEVIDTVSEDAIE